MCWLAEERHLNPTMIHIERPLAIQAHVLAVAVSVKICSTDFVRPDRYVFVELVRQ